MLMCCHVQMQFACACPHKVWSAVLGSVFLFNIILLSISIFRLLNIIILHLIILNIITCTS